MRAIPKGLPPRSTLFDCLDLWSYDGALDRIHHVLYVECREQGEREASPTAAVSPHALLCVNHGHWGIEIMPRNNDVILGEDADTSRCDNAPGNIFSLTNFIVKILKSASPSPTRAIEPFQDDRNRALRRFSDSH